MGSFDLPFFERQAELSRLPVILCRPWTRYHEVTLIFGTSRGIETEIGVGSMLVEVKPDFYKVLVLWFALELIQVLQMTAMVQIFKIGVRSYFAYQIKTGVSF